MRKLSVNDVIRVVGVAALFVALVPAPVRVGIQAQDDVCVASTPSGRVRGQQRGAACAFLGIPYATAPVGNLRWKPPQPRAPWAPVVLDARSAPPACPTISPPGGPAGTPSGNEDCLILNIWAPARPGRARMPVIVWFHTGDFRSASASLPAFNGERLAQEENVIIVAPNTALARLASWLTAPSPLKIRLTGRRATTGFSISARRSCGCAITSPPSEAIPGT